jgi:hypothetical protein
MVIHSSERFMVIVALLNQEFGRSMIFQLVGSLAQKPASYNDADIVVHPLLPLDLEAFSQGCMGFGTEILETDTNSKTPFPGRPEGQDRIRLKVSSGDVIDLFFPKGSLKPMTQ